MNTVELGKYLGYPECCIKQFMEDGPSYKLRIAKFPGLRELLNGAGFVPCDVCVNKLMVKEVRLDDLIQNRQCPIPFPFRDWMPDQGEFDIREPKLS